MAALVSALVAVVLALSGCEPAGDSGRRWTGTVVRVIDGDTLDIRTTLGVVRRVRVLGLDAPELLRNQPQCGAREAADVLQALAEPGRRVVVQRYYRENARDRWGRFLGHVRLRNGPDVAGHMIENGFAVAWAPKSATVEGMSELRRKQSAAQAEKRGLWAACPVVGGVRGVRGAR